MKRWTTLENNVLHSKAWDKRYDTKVTVYNYGDEVYQSAILVQKHMRAAVLGDTPAYGLHRWDLSTTAKIKEPATSQRSL